MWRAVAREGMVVARSSAKRGRSCIWSAQARGTSSQRTGYRMAEQPRAEDVREKNKTTFIYLASVVMFGGKYDMSASLIL